MASLRSWLKIFRHCKRVDVFTAIAEKAGISLVRASLIRSSLIRSSAVS
jgi:hypothetical protein